MIKMNNSNAFNLNELQDNLSEKESPIKPPSSSSTSTTLPSLRIDFRNEVILLFFNSMLETIIESWEPLTWDDLSECCDSIPSVANQIVCNKSYQEVVGEDFEDLTIIEVEDSNISLGKQMSVEEINNVESERKFVKEQKVNKKRNNNSSFKKRAKKLSAIKQKKISKEIELNSTSFLTKQSSKSSALEDTSWMISSIDEHVNIIFKNGNAYRGSIRRKRMHGSGTFIWNDGTRYKGDFTNGEITGKGEMHLTDMNWYSGEFRNGYRHGTGRMITRGDPLIYNGCWQCGLKHGHGWIMYCPGNWYEGGWRFDLMHGHGLRRYQSGSRYLGQFENGQRNGFGCALFRNNDVPTPTAPNFAILQKYCGY